MKRDFDYLMQHYSILSDPFTFTLRSSTPTAKSDIESLTIPALMGMFMGEAADDDKIKEEAAEDDDKRDYFSLDIVTSLLAPASAGFEDKVKVVKKMAKKGNNNFNSKFKLLKADCLREEDESQMDILVK